MQEQSHLGPDMLYGEGLNQKVYFRNGHRNSHRAQPCPQVPQCQAFQICGPAFISVFRFTGIACLQLCPSPFSLESAVTSPLLLPSGLPLPSSSLQVAQFHSLFSMNKLLVFVSDFIALCSDLYFLVYGRFDSHFSYFLKFEVGVLT